MPNIDTPATRQAMQRLFDKMVHHVLKQNKPSLRPLPERVDQSSSDQCAYRGAGGTMCAVGCLISDEHYDIMLEGKSALHSAVISAVVLSQDLLVVSGPGLIIEMLGRAQRLLHDDPARAPTAAFRSMVLAGAEEIAVDFNLRMPADLP